MPEMPEVETVRRQLTSLLVGRTVRQVLLGEHRRFADAHRSVGSTVGSLRRRGKFLVVDFSSGPGCGWEMIVHLGMTGGLLWDTSQPGHARVGWRFDDGMLWFNDPRRFGRVLWVQAGDYAMSPTLRELGQDVDDPVFDRQLAAGKLAGAGSPVKALLLAQRAIAGVGNYLADEALWRAMIHPNARNLLFDDALRLVDALVGVVNDSLAAGGASIRDYVQLDGSSGGFAAQFDVYGRAGAPCRRCAAVLTSVKVGGRTSVFCPVCQRP